MTVTSNDIPLRSLFDHMAHTVKDLFDPFSPRMDCGCDFVIHYIERKNLIFIVLFLKYVCSTFLHSQSRTASF